MRRFDPRAVGRFECRAWETYYGVEPGSVRQAAALRAEAMDVSDRWVKARSYAALLAAVHR